MAVNALECFSMEWNCCEWCWIAVNGVEWLWMVLNGCEWCCMAVNGVEWLWMVLNGLEWCWMALNGVEWLWMFVYLSLLTIIWFCMLNGLNGDEWCEWCEWRAICPFFWIKKPLPRQGSSRKLKTLSNFRAYVVCISEIFVFEGFLDFFWFDRFFI